MKILTLMFSILFVFSMAVADENKDSFGQSVESEDSSIENRFEQTWMPYSTQIGFKVVTVMFPSEPFVMMMPDFFIDGTQFCLAYAEDNDIEYTFGIAHIPSKFKRGKDVIDYLYKNYAAAFSKIHVLDKVHILDMLDKDEGFTYFSRFIADDFALYLSIVKFPSESKEALEQAKYFLKSFTFEN